MSPAPLDDVAIERLLARDHLLREPYGDTCCGEGAIRLSEVRWAELDGQPPEELVLTLQEYVGEGCVTDHHHVYDVSGTAPRAVGVLSDSGYDVFPYLSILDLDGDGAAELLAVGPSNGGAVSTLAVHRVVGGALVQAAPTLQLGRVYLPFDVDGDGALEIVALRDGSLAAVDLAGRPTPVPVEAWLPAVYEEGLVRSAGLGARLERTSDTLELLSGAMQERGLLPPHRARAFDAALDGLTDGAHPYTVATSVWWAPTRAQHRRLVGLLHTPAAEPAAWLALGTPGEDDEVERWLLGRMDGVLLGREALPGSPLLTHLDPAAKDAICGHVGPLLLADGQPEARGELSFWALPPLGCREATVAVLEAPALPRQVVRGAIAAVDRGAGRPDPRVAAALQVRLEGPDPVLAAEAARALRTVEDAAEPLRRTLLTNPDPEVQRSALVALAALPAGAPDPYLSLLARPLDPEVRRRVHGELARSTDPEIVRRGLAEVERVPDYESWHWRPVYRTDTVPEGVRAVLREDAAARLRSPEPRIRRLAAEVLGALGPDGHEAALEAAAAGDEVEWVRAAAAAALGRDP